MVGIISCGLLLLVYGETRFNLLGFIVVMVASMLSGLRWTITQVLLQGTGQTGHGASGGPVEVLLQLTPGQQPYPCCLVSFLRKGHVHNCCSQQLISMFILLCLKLFLRNMAATLLSCPSYVTAC